MLKRIASRMSLFSPAPSVPNPALVAVLDGAQQPDTADEPTAAADTGVGASIEGEHEARVKAEDAAQDALRRLNVAQQQFAEYASTKAADAEVLVQQSTQLEQLLNQMAAGLRGEGDVNAAPDSATGALAAITALRERLAETASEAAAFAQLQQQSADAERPKRNSVQASCGSNTSKEGDAYLPDTGSQESESKRQRSDDNSTASDAEHDGPEDMELENGLSVNTGSAALVERAKYIPLRLNAEERRLLRLLEATLSVSEYTDKVDILSWKSKNARVHQQIKDICAILCGLVIAQDYRKGQRMVTDRNFRDNATFFQDVFEVGRRFKTMNPDRMRNTYGMLMYMLMDSSEEYIKELLEFKCTRPLRTVYTQLEQTGALAVLEDPLAVKATAEIIAGDRLRGEIQRDIKVKERAREALARKYRSASISEEEILQCLYSVGDNNSFLLFNRDPVDRMLQLLKEFFDPAAASDPAGSLAICMGRSGARLTHSHQKQYIFVLQSLTLWREVHDSMFQLWCLADADMLSESNSYRLSNTGQGLNRVQAAPRISKAMHNILWRCQQRLGGWVGSSVVHIGDTAVPNALMMIDKYTQVPRILNPVVQVVDSLPKLCKDEKLAAYVQSIWGGVQQCRKAILQDFFRHAFDGSGADNSFDAGSCIDGRLTSAWNWCSQLDKKNYAPIFRIAELSITCRPLDIAEKRLWAAPYGFQSFDGDLGR